MTALPLTIIHNGDGDRTQKLRTFSDHISATQGPTSVTLQISTKAGSLMKTSGTVDSYTIGLFFIYSLSWSRSSTFCNLQNHGLKSSMSVRKETLV